MVMPASVRNPATIPVHGQRSQKASTAAAINNPANAGIAIRGEVIQSIISEMKSSILLILSRFGVHFPVKVGYFFAS